MCSDTACYLVDLLVGCFIHIEQKLAWYHLRGTTRIRDFAKTKSLSYR